jgi:hypothetical protein
MFENVGGDKVIMIKGSCRILMLSEELKHEESMTKGL